MRFITNASFSENVDELLSTFPRHGLEDLNNSSLMNRVDSKFLIEREQLTKILEHCQQHYSLLEINGINNFRYQSSYYDTDDMAFFHMHHKGKLNRIKIRHRNYVDTGKAFVELKFKNNKGRTIKSRVAACKDPLLALNQSEQFLIDKNIVQPSSLKIVQSGEYNRFSLANETLGERLTIDSGLQFLDTQTWKYAKLNNAVIVELKQQKHNRESPLYKAMRTMAIRPQSFSKYCMGMTLTSASRLKTNRFKKNFLQLKKLENM